METLYKVLDEKSRSMHGGDAIWTPGEWMPAVEGELEPCANGYHLCRASDLVNWLGPAIWVAEYRGERIDCDAPQTSRTETKVVVRQARIVRRLDTWNERTARLFACDCAERALPIFEREVPGDLRPRQTIETARRFANGQATEADRAAARDAAWDAARDAAMDAARDAAWAAAWAAARAAAWDAAWAAAWDAAWEAQNERLTAAFFGLHQIRL